ncbi:alpha/beta fold hydrolase [Persicimonas caeni]|uniref:Alpha/beta fold hydrolase n=1 Tax=Persicimonas caeni TaxID=2292766 RepID=A0A4Y6PMD2_PERCE|nr:alpha/beta fold hydrolase [Persicimonas caeni]QDG49410.1 alpha/beta fold hydrolase [Persicimonas caeni]QED30631.1 alpha/beta fold hydrolase [Persicimonas caeni]
MDKLTAPALPHWLDTMLPFERYCVRVDDRTMHVMEYGEGRPVLMIHGNPTWGFLWRKVAAKLDPKEYRCIMPDLVGLGLSEKPHDPEAHTLENHARWMGELVDALDLDDVILVVQDWGGPIGLLAMAERAERLGGIVLGNTVVSEPKEGFKPTLFHRFSQMPIVSDLAFRVLGFPQVALGIAQGDRKSISGEIAKAYRWPLRSLSNRAAPLALARMVPDTMEHPSVAPLQRVREFFTDTDVPVQVVWGTNDPVLGRVLGWVKKLRPDAPVCETRAGHFLQEEVPDDLADAVRAI